MTSTIRTTEQALELIQEMHCTKEQKANLTALIDAGQFRSAHMMLGSMPYPNTSLLLWLGIKAGVKDLQPRIDPYYV